MKPIINLILILTISKVSMAQEIVQLDQVIEKVKSYSQELKVKIADKKIAKSSKRQALGYALPQITAKIGHSEYLKVPSFGGFQLQGNYELDYGFTINQALYTFGAVGAALKAAKVGLDMVDLDILASENNVTYVAKTAYYQVLLAKRNVQINQNLVKNAQDNLSILRNSFQGGRPPQGDLIRLQADIENKKPLLENANAELKNAIINLNILMGEDPNKKIDVAGELNSNFPLLDSVYLENMFNTHSPAIKALKKNVEFQESLADVERSDMFPKLGAFYSFGRNNQSLSDDRFAVDRKIETSVIGVAINWNVWDGGTSNAEYQIAKVTASKSEFELQKTKDTLSQQIFSTMEKVNGFKVNVSSYDKAVDLARRSFQLSQNRFRSGKTSITELNDTQSLLLQSELQQALNLFQMNVAYAQIENLIGAEIKK